MKDAFDYRNFYYPFRSSLHRRPPPPFDGIAYGAQFTGCDTRSKCCVVTTCSQSRMDEQGQDQNLVDGEVS
jgi:hypothetical protein